MIKYRNGRDRAEGAGAAGGREGRSDAVGTWEKNADGGVVNSCEQPGVKYRGGRALHMSSVLFLTHRSRARVNAREERGMGRERWRGARGEGGGKRRNRMLELRSGGAREGESRGRFARAREHMLGGRAKRNGRGAPAAPARRIGEDRTKMGRARTRYRTEGGEWMDGRAESAREFVCPFRRARPARIDSAPSFGY